MHHPARYIAARLAHPGWLGCAMMAAAIAALCGCGAAQQGAMINADKKLAKKDYAGALAKLDNAENYTKPSSNLQARICYLRGVCFQGLGSYADARGSFQFVTNRFPETEYAELSRQRLTDLPRAEADEFVANLESGSPLENYDTSTIGEVRKKWWKEVENKEIKVKKKQVVKVTFKQFADGRIEDIRVTNSNSDKQNLEELAIKAISDSAPFPQWPSEVQPDIKEPRSITITFTYKP